MEFDCIMTHHDQAYTVGYQYTILLNFIINTVTFYFITLLQLPMQTSNFDTVQCVSRTYDMFLNYTLCIIGHFSLFQNCYIKVELWQSNGIIRKLIFCKILKCLVFTIWMIIKRRDILNIESYNESINLWLNSGTKSVRYACELASLEMKIGHQYYIILQTIDQDV